MSETPSTPANTGATTPAPETTAGTTGTDAGVSGLADNGGTGNPADAGTTPANPTDSSSVSDDEGVQSLAAQEAAQQEKRDEVAAAQAEHQERVDVDHEGTGPGDDVDNLPESNVSDEDQGQ